MTKVEVSYSKCKKCNNISILSDLIENKPDAGMVCKNKEKCKIRAEQLNEAEHNKALHPTDCK